MKHATALRRAPLRSTARAARPSTSARGTRRFVILTGLSGSGKTQAIRALEDLGYFCIDNLPTQLIPTMVELATRADTALQKVAIVVDVREKEFLKRFPKVFRKLRTTPKVNPMLIFLEASHSALEHEGGHALVPLRAID